MKRIFFFYFNKAKADILSVFFYKVTLIIEPIILFQFDFFSKGMFSFNTVLIYSIYPCRDTCPSESTKTYKNQGNAVTINEC